MKVKQIKFIRWLDSCNCRTPNWKNKKDVADLDPVEMHTVGFVVKETKKYITVVGTRGQADHYIGEMCIPKGTIIETQDITV